jgi:hypothetical protein
MRFSALFTISLAAGASAGIVPAFINTERGVLAAASMSSMLGMDCRCWPDNTGAAGTHIDQGAAWYECAYPAGACTWDDVSFSRHGAHT